MAEGVVTYTLLCSVCDHHLCCLSLLNIPFIIIIAKTNRANLINHKLGLSRGSTRLRQLAWSYPTKLNIVFIVVFHIGLNIKLNIGLIIGFNIGFNIGVQYWV